MRKGSANRDQSGMYLIELLVAIAISAFFAAVLGASLGQTISISNRAENNWFASNIANQVMDRLRSTQFDSLPASNQTYNVRVNLGDPSDTNNYQSNTPILNRPLLLDLTNFRWATGSSISTVPGYKFRGNVTLTLVDGPVKSPGSSPISKTATVTVTWTDSSSQKSHTHTLTRMLSRFGIQRNVQM